MSIPEKGHCVPGLEEYRIGEEILPLPLVPTDQSAIVELNALLETSSLKSKIEEATRLLGIEEQLLFDSISLRVTARNVVETENHRDDIRRLWIQIEDTRVLINTVLRECLRI